MEASQAVRADAKKMMLARPLKAGTVTTYKANIKANVQGMDVAIEQTQKQTSNRLRRTAMSLLSLRSGLYNP